MNSSQYKLSEIYQNKYVKLFFFFFLLILISRFRAQYIWYKGYYAAYSAVTIFIIVTTVIGGTIWLEKLKTSKAKLLLIILSSSIMLGASFLAYFIEQIFINNY